MQVEYNSNNSGGSWWLKDEDWQKLEDAGWEVIWGGYWFCGATDKWHQPPAGVEQPYLDDKDKCHGHRQCTSLAEVDQKDKRWLDAAAVYAIKHDATEDQAIREWEYVLGMDADEEGCDCCGRPHSFSER